MSKKKWYILGGISFCLLSAGVAVFLIKPAKAETTSTTFPVNEAGIAAYVKVDNIEDIDIDALATVLHTVESQAESYVIGTIGIPTEETGWSGGGYIYSYPHLYVGLDGWIVAYYLNTEEASRITQWQGYTAGSIDTTTLQDAMEIMSHESGLTYSTTSVKYYNFEFPEANKMTFIAETGQRNRRSNSFYVTVPGTLYEASYRVSGRSSSGIYNNQITLKVDGITLVKEEMNDIVFEAFYGYYDTNTYFKAGDTHYVSLGCGINCAVVRGSTVLIYKN